MDIPKARIDFRQLLAAGAVQFLTWICRCDMLAHGRGPPFSMLYFLNSPVLDFWEFETNKLLCCSTALAWQVRDQYHFGFLLIHFSMNYYKTLWVSHIVSALTTRNCQKNLIRIEILFDST